MRAARPSRALFLAVAGTAAALPAREALAYPQFQLSSGHDRCNECHFAPAGGGLLNSHGRDEAGDTVSRGGDGSFLHGLWAPPPWMALGADLRLAGLMNDVQDPDGAQWEAFPMQGDLYLWLGRGAWSVSGIGGLRAVARNDGPDPSQWPTQRLTDRLISREHFAMWRPGNLGPYVRVGRFFAPYGLRLAEHTSFIRRYEGFNLFEESYGASGGYVAQDWEVHATAFTPPPYEQVGAAESGGAVYFERRLGGKAGLGAQSRVGIAGDEARYQAGLTGKLWIEGAKLLFMAEADGVRQTFAAPSGTAALPSRTQFVGFFSATFIPIRGLFLALQAQRFDEDMSIQNLARNAFGAQINYFPWAHFEAVLSAGTQIFDGGGGDRSDLVMLQLHYYL